MIIMYINILLLTELISRIINVEYFTGKALNDINRISENTNPCSGETTIMNCDYTQDRDGCALLLSFPLLLVSVQVLRVTCTLKTSKEIYKESFLIVVSS